MNMSNGAHEHCCHYLPVEVASREWFGLVLEVRVEVALLIVFFKAEVDLSFLPLLFLFYSFNVSDFGCNLQHFLRKTNLKPESSLRGIFDCVYTN